MQRKAMVTRGSGPNAKNIWIDDHLTEIEANPHITGITTSAHGIVSSESQPQPQAQSSEKIQQQE